MIGDYYAEEVEHLTRAGLDAETIATRMGVTPGAISKGLRRAGRVDLARPFEALHNRHRALAADKRCVDCGARISCLKAQRCFGCGHVVRARKWAELYGSKRVAS